MVTIDAYEDVIDSVYLAGEGNHPLDDMLRQLCRTFDAASSGFSVYDDAGDRISHTIVYPPQPASQDHSALLRQMIDDPGSRLFSRRLLTEPRRISDVIPASRLHTAGWIVLQEQLVGLKHCAAMDLWISGLRVRIFLLMAIGDRDFDDSTLRLFGYVGRHVERAFRLHLDLLAPHKDDPSTFVFHHGDLAARMRGGSNALLALQTKYGLTAAESRVATTAAAGRSRTETAAELGLSIHTVNTHLRHAFGKIGVRRIGELILAINALNAS